MPIALSKWKGLLVAVIAAIVPAASAVAAPLVYGEIATAKIQPNTPPKASGPVALYGARNEFVSFQVVVNGAGSGASHVSASFSGLSGPASIGGNDITLYREALMHVSQATSFGAQPGDYPDGLIPDVDEVDHQKRNAFPFDVPANQSRAIWVDVHVPQGAAPGSYTGTVKLAGDGFTDSVPVNLTVLPATLPSTSSLPSAFLIFDGNVCLAHTGTSDCGSASTRNELVSAYERLALDHRVTLSNVTQQPSGTDWTMYDSTWGPLLDGTAATRLAGAKMTSVQYTGARDATHYTDFAQHLQAKGWLARAYDYTADEPGWGSSWSSVASRAQLVRQGAPSLSTLVTTTIQDADQNGVSGDIDTMVVEVNFIDGNSGKYVGDLRSSYDSWLAGQNKHLWLYQSCDVHSCAAGAAGAGNAAASWPSYMIDAKAAHNRAMQWEVFAENAHGELYFETADMLPTAWSDQFAFNGNGDGTLFYPGTPQTIGGTSQVPVPSIRLKLLRMGMQDYEWLKLVSDAGDPSFAQQMAHSVVPTASQVSPDGAAFEQARRQLEQRYLQLKPGPVASTDSSGSTTSSTDPGSTGSGSSAVDPLTGGADQPKAGGCGATGAAAIPGGALLLGAWLLTRRRRLA
jgi:hypothetical protein